MVNYKDGVIRDGSSIGSGNVLGNLKRDVVRRGTSSSPGNGQVVGNVRNGIIREGSSSSPGNGDVIGSVKGGIVFRGTSSSAGNGTKVGRVSDFAIKGMERERDDQIVAAYHFLIKKFL